VHQCGQIQGSGPASWGFGLIVSFAIAPATARAQGALLSSPTIPTRPGPGYWEINLSTFFQKNRLERRLETPRLDINYGVGRRIQLKYEMPWVGVRPPGQPSRAGPGNAVAGVKWRFFGEEGHNVAWSVYPQLEFNIDHSSVAQGLAEEWPAATASDGDHGRVGPLRDQRRGRTPARRARENAWVYGVSTEARITRGLELLGELHGERGGTAPTELIVNRAARHKLTRRVILMLAVGCAVMECPTRGRACSSSPGSS
jgi:hypothetical protein